MQTGQCGHPVVAQSHYPQNHARPDAGTHLGPLDDSDAGPLGLTQVQQLRAICRIWCGQPRLNGVPRGGG